jgi:hypothetical protein
MVAVNPTRPIQKRSVGTRTSKKRAALLEPIPKERNGIFQVSSATTMAGFAKGEGHQYSD